MSIFLALVFSSVALLQLVAGICPSGMHCYNEWGDLFCCDTGNPDPLSQQAAQQRPGLCPPLRHTVEATDYNPCAYDSECPYFADKCCFDRALNFKVCKPAMYPEDKVLWFAKKKTVSVVTPKPEEKPVKQKPLVQHPLYPAAQWPIYAPNFPHNTQPTQQQSNHGQKAHPKPVFDYRHYLA